MHIKKFTAHWIDESELNGLLSNYNLKISDVSIDTALHEHAGPNWPIPSALVSLKERMECLLIVIPECEDEVEISISECFRCLEDFTSFTKDFLKPYQYDLLLPHLQKASTSLPNMVTCKRLLPDDIIIHDELGWVWHSYSTFNARSKTQMVESNIQVENKAALAIILTSLFEIKAFRKDLNLDELAYVGHVISGASPKTFRKFLRGTVSKSLKSKHVPFTAQQYTKASRYLKEAVELIDKLLEV